MGGTMLNQLGAVAQEGTERPKVRLGTQRRFQQPIAVQGLEPLTVQDVAVPSWHVLDCLGAAQAALNTTGVQGLKERDPVGSAVGEVPTLGPFPSAFLQTGRAGFPSSGFPVTPSGGRWWRGRPACISP
jgi:hypothetical protein